MKKEILTLTMAAGLAVLPLFVTGCSTAKGVKTSESAVSSMQDIEDQLIKAGDQITVTITSLNEIGKTVKIDPKRAYKEFSGNVESLEKLSKEIGARNEKMKAKADAVLSDGTILDLKTTQDASPSSFASSIARA